MKKQLNQWHFKFIVVKHLDAFTEVHIHVHMKLSVLVIQWLCTYTRLFVSTHVSNLVVCEK